MRAINDRDVGDDPGSPAGNPLLSGFRDSRFETFLLSGSRTSYPFEFIDQHLEPPEGDPILNDNPPEGSIQ
jgi:hypothetical protein